MLVTETNLVKSCDVERLLAERAACEKAVDQLIDAAHALGGRVGEIEVCGMRFPYVNRDGIMADVDSRFWVDLMNRSGLRTFMDANRRDKWDRQMYSNSKRRDEIPEFTAENIEATFGTLFLQRGAMVLDGIEQIYRSLSWEYKTNQPVAIGSKIITYVGDGRGRTADKLDDLDRFAHVVNGRPEPDHRESMSAKFREQHSWIEPKQFEIESANLRVKVFKNGNAHVWFKDQATVDRFNQMIAERFPGCLPPARI